MAITRLNNNSITSITALPNLAGVGGITMADQWRTTTTHLVEIVYLTTNCYWYYTEHCTTWFFKQNISFNEF